MTPSKCHFTNRLDCYAWRCKFMNDLLNGQKSSLNWTLFVFHFFQSNECLFPRLDLLIASALMALLLIAGRFCPACAWNENTKHYLLIFFNIFLFVLLVPLILLSSIITNWHAIQFGKLKFKKYDFGFWFEANLPQFTISTAIAPCNLISF